MDAAKNLLEDNLITPLVGEIAMGPHGVGYEAYLQVRDGTMSGESMKSVQENIIDSFNNFIAFLWYLPLVTPR